MNDKLQEIIEEYENKKASVNDEYMIVLMFNDLMCDLRILNLELSKRSETCLRGKICPVHGVGDCCGAEHKEQSDDSEMLVDVMSKIKCSMLCLKTNYDIDGDSMIDSDAYKYLEDALKIKQAMKEGG